MIYFIEAQLELNKLREQMLINTREVINVLNKRKELSQSIGKLKSILGIDVRDYQREREVFNNLEFDDITSRAIVNLLFELSIQSQRPLISSIKWKELRVLGKEFNILTGSSDFVLIMAGLIASKPGGVVYTMNPLPNMLELGLILGGSHIINSEAESSAIRIYYNKKILHDNAFIFDDPKGSYFGVPADSLKFFGKMDVVII